MVVGAVVLAVVLNRVKGAAPDVPVLNLLLPSGVDGARAVLQVVAASVVTVTSVVFSLTVVALQITAGNYSPRVLRTFLRDFGTQVVLGTFLATFAFTYVLLQNVRSMGKGAGPSWAPEPAFLAVPLFVGASLAALVFFIHHVTRSIRVDLLVGEVLEDLLGTIEKTQAGPRLRAKEHVRELVPAHAETLTAPRSGFIEAIGAERLTELLQQADAEVVFRPTVGDHVLRDAPVAWVWSRRGAGGVPDEVRQKVTQALQIGQQRSLKQDVAFGIRQLVDIAVRALSPGVNDPNTAVSVILHLAIAYRRLLDCGTGPAVFLDEGGERRATVPYPSLDEYLHIAIQQIAHYGHGDLMIILRLLRTLGDLRQLADEADREVLARHIGWVLQEAELGLEMEANRETARIAADDVLNGGTRVRHYTAAG